MYFYCKVDRKTQSINQGNVRQKKANGCLQTKYLLFYVENEMKKNTQEMSPSKADFICAEQNCKKKYKKANQLKMHYAFFHNTNPNEDREAVFEIVVDQESEPHPILSER